MPTQMPADARNDLVAFYRAEVQVVNQHFIDVITLRAWGGVDDVAAIQTVDNADFPNAMRLAAALTSSGSVREMMAGADGLRHEMPKPGATATALFSAEAEIEDRFMTALETCEGLDIQLRHLVDVPRSAHRGFAGWINDRLQSSDLPAPPGVRPLDRDAQAALDDLFALQVLSINQGLVHAFLHRATHDKPSADATWTSISAVMHQAGDLVTLTAKRGACIQPSNAALLDTYVPANVSDDPALAVEADRVLSERCAASAGQAAAVLSGTEFEDTLTEIADDRTRWAEWSPGQPVPETNAPCRDLGRVLEKYVWLDTVA